MNQHEQTIKRLIPIAEAGDSKMAAYREIAEEIDAWMSEDSTLTTRAVAGRIGKSHRWVVAISKALVRMRTTGGDFYIDWQSGSNRRADLVTTVPKKPADQVTMATALLSQPGIAEAVVRSHTPAARAVKRAVSTMEYEEMRGRMDAIEHARRDRAIPIGGMLARIAGKLNDWSGELVAVKEDLADASGTPGARMVVLALRDLGDTCHQIANELDPDLQSLTVIDA